ncbi:MAG: SPOR domain-containing protein [Thermodesulfobacteriota bacterium]
MAAARRQKKRFAFRFELGIGGMLGLGVVCCCIFLWMFLLGVWSGQTILLPAAPGKGAAMLTGMAAGLWEKSRSLRESGGRAVDLPATAPTAAVGDTLPSTVATTSSSPAEASFFSLQVGSFRDKKKAQREVLAWQAKGRDAFSLPPEEGTDVYRVFIGRFERLADANQLAAGLEKEEEVRVYITLLPESAVTGAAGQ